MTALEVRFLPFQDLFLFVTVFVVSAAAVCWSEFSGLLLRSLHPSLCPASETGARVAPWPANDSQSSFSAFNSVSTPLRRAPCAQRDLITLPSLRSLLVRSLRVSGGETQRPSQAFPGHTKHLPLYVAF